MSAAPTRARRMPESIVFSLRWCAAGHRRPPSRTARRRRPVSSRGSSSDAFPGLERDPLLGVVLVAVVDTRRARRRLQRGSARTRCALGGCRLRPCGSPPSAADRDRGSLSGRARAPSAAAPSSRGRVRSAVAEDGLAGVAVLLLRLDDRDAVACKRHAMRLACSLCDAGIVHQPVSRSTSLQRIRATSPPRWPSGVGPSDRCVRRADGADRVVLAPFARGRPGACSRRS